MTKSSTSKSKFTALKLLVVAGVIAVALLVAYKPADPLTQVLETGTLTVAMRTAPTVYYEHRDGPAGFEYELVRSFADYLGVELKILEYPNAQAMQAAVSRKEADLAAGSLGLTLQRQKGFRVSDPLLNSSQVFVYRSGYARPRSWEDLTPETTLAVVAGSYQAEVLRSHQVLYPHLSWMETQDLEVADLLKLVQDGDLDYALVSVQDFNINSFFFPRVAIAFDAAIEASLVWLFPKSGTTSLVQAANEYIQQAKDLGRIEAARERYFKHEQYLEYVGATLFLRHVRSRLPQYEQYFRTAAEQQDINWLLLAAVAFQESHWNPKAVSPTGVRGLMMLTRVTARELKVDRLDPVESIEGGARYLRRLYNRLPASVEGDNRVYMALAAYNVGMGHLEDARKITQGQGFDPNQWEDVAQHLPLLAQHKWYSKTRFGYARGAEPVTYVQNIRRYLEILEWHQRSQAGFLEQLEERAEKTQFETAFRLVPATI